MLAAGGAPGEGGPGQGLREVERAVQPWRGVFQAESSQCRA